MAAKKKALGIQVGKLGLNEVEVVRRTTETEITCRIRHGPRQSWDLSTGLNFLNHMIEELAYFSEFNIDTVVKSPHYLLNHTTIEDAGITLGRAFYELATERGKKIGVRGFGSGQCILDEAFAEGARKFRRESGNLHHKTR